MTHRGGACDDIVASNTGAVSRGDTGTLGKGTASFATRMCTNARAESIWKMEGATEMTHAIPHAVLASTEGEMLGSHRVCGKVKKSKVVQSQRGGVPYTVPDTGGGADLVRRVVAG